MNLYEEYWKKERQITDDESKTVTKIKKFDSEFESLVKENLKRINSFTLDKITCNYILIFNIFVGKIFKNKFLNTTGSSNKGGSRGVTGECSPFKKNYKIFNLY